MARKVSVIVIVGALALCSAVAAWRLRDHGHPVIPPTLPPAQLKSIHDKLAASAVDQTTWGTVYDPSYVKLPYPNGDLPRTKGVCTDVVIRALRSQRFDLQRAIYEDAGAHPSRYPRIKSRDSSIDHRRCPNLIAYFSAYAQRKSIDLNPKDAKDWRPGDIVFWKLPFGKDHVGMLSFGRNADGFPLVIHNIGNGPQEEDVLRSWTLVGRFRFPKGERF